MKKYLLCFMATWLCFGNHGSWAQTAEELATASVENPLDLSFKMVNPSFDEGDVITGWEGDAFTTTGGKANAQHLSKFYTTYQKVKGLPHGVYAVGVKAFYRPGTLADAYARYRNQEDACNAAELFVQTETKYNWVPLKTIFDGAQEKKQGKGTEGQYRDTEAGKTKYVPANLIAAEYYMHELGLYDNTLVLGIFDDEVIIGVDKSWIMISNDWSVFDDFTLMYYGTGDDAAQLWRDRVLSSYENEEFREPVSPVVKDRYQTAVEALRSALTFNDVKACVEAVDKAYNDWWDNSGMWNSLVYQIEECEMRANSGSFSEESSQAMLAIVAEAKAALENLTMDNDELEVLYNKFKDAYNNMMNQPVDGADMTFLIENPEFEDYANYWYTNINASGGNIGVAGTNDNKCFEAWNCPSFDIYQYIGGAPLGVYEIQVQGFYRYQRDQASWNSYKAQNSNYVKPGGAPVYVYINDSKTPLMNIYEEKVPVGDLYVTDPSLLFPDNLPPFGDDEGYWYPNEMYNSALAFSQGLYTQSAYGIVASENDLMQIGVVGKTNQANDSWAIWDNFRLIYHGYKADVVQPVLENTLADGQKLLSELMGRIEHNQLAKAVDDATKALASAEGEAMFKALAALYTAMAQATDSKDVFMEHEVNIDAVNLASIIGDYDHKSINKALLDEAHQLLNGIIGCAIYETEQVEQIHDDVITMMDNLILTGVAYDELGNALLQLTFVLNSIEESQNSSDLVNEAKALYVDVLTNYTNGTYDKETAEAKQEEVKQMIARLNEMGISSIIADGGKVEFFTVDGRRLEHAQKGVVIMKMTRADGSVTVRKLNTSGE